MVWGIYAIESSEGKHTISLAMEKNAMKMEDSKGVYYLWPINEGLYRIRFADVERPKGSGNYLMRIEIDSAPGNAKVPEKLEELLKKYEIH